MVTTSAFGKMPPIEGLEPERHVTTKIGASGVCTGLQFQSVSASVLSHGHQNNRVLISWSIQNTARQLNAVKYFIYRGESPSELTRLNAEGIPGNAGILEYVDHTANLLDFSKNYVYQVRAEEYTSTNVLRQAFLSWTFEIAGVEDKTALYVVSEHNFLYRHTAAGVPVFVYKRRFDGVVCPECWDEVMQRVTKSNCLTCAGTGKDGGGYYPPIEAWMAITIPPVESSVQMTGIGQNVTSRFDFTNYPILRAGDIIVEAKTNNFHKVITTQSPTRNGVLFLQNGALDLINRSDVEYKAILVPEARRRELIKKLNEKIAGDAL